MGVASNSWFDRVVLSTLYMFKPSCRPILKPPSLGPPYFPLQAWDPEELGRRLPSERLDTNLCLRADRRFVYFKPSRLEVGAYDRKHLTIIKITKPIKANSKQTIMT